MAKIKSVLKQSERIVLIGVVLGSILVAIFVLVIEPFTGWFPELNKYVPAITLILLSSFILFYFARERMLSEYADYIRWRALGIRTIYRNRTDTAQFDAYIQLLNSVEKDLFIVGITLKDTPRAHMPLLLKKAKQGCSLAFLMLSPKYWKNEDPILDPVAAAVAADLRPNFQMAITTIRALAMSMVEMRAKTEVRFYHQAPTLSLTVVDGNSGFGKMRVELTPHNSPQYGYFRPMLDLEHTASDDLFSQFYQHYRALWDGSPIYLEIRDSRIWVNQALDEEVSSELDLPSDWLPKELQAPG